MVLEGLVFFVTTTSMTLFLHTMILLSTSLVVKNTGLTAVTIIRSNLLDSYCESRELVIPQGSGLQEPYAVELDPVGGKIYWTDIGTGKIQRANLDDGSHIEDLVPASTRSLELDVSGGKLYWVAEGRIHRANLDGTGIEDITTKGTPVDISLDLVHDKLYWVASVPNYHLMRANFDGTEAEIVSITGANRPVGIALDRRDGKLYWGDIGSNTIKQANLDGSKIETVVNAELPVPLPGITLDELNRKLYWADIGVEQIKRSDLDGSNVEDLISVAATSIAIDTVGEKIYFASSNDLRRANLDGTNIENVLIDDFVVNMVALDTANRNLYYAETQAPSAIVRTSIDRQADPEFKLEPLVSIPKLIFAFLLEPLSQRLYWLSIAPGSRFESFDTRILQRSTLNGRGIQTVATLGMSVRFPLD